jgi:hypothetical protein
MFSDQFIVNVISESKMHTPVYNKIIIDTPVCKNKNKNQLTCICQLRRHE